MAANESNPNPNPTPASGTPGAAPAPTTPTLPVRKLPPYYDIRPDQTSTYFVPGNYPVVKSFKERISRFLADGKRVPDVGQTLRIEYSLGTIPADQLRPLRYITETELKNFEAAARDFYDQALPDSKTPESVKNLRTKFKLPDPDREPDAYWVHGEKYDPKILILWGCEKTQGTSLPLMNEPKLGFTGPNAVDKLRKRLLSWEEMQKLALEMIDEVSDPLGRFLAKAVLDANGKVISVEKKGQVVSIEKFKKLKPLPKKSLPRKQFREFREACIEFYRKAQPEDTSAEGEGGKPKIGSWEKELRRNFRLPDPDRLADSYWLFNGKLVVLYSGTDIKENCLPLCQDTVLGLGIQQPAATPAASAGADPDFLAAAKKPAKQAPAPLPTVVDKLKQREKSLTMVIVAAASVVLLAGVGFLAGSLLTDKEPPVLTKAEISNDVKADPKNERKVLLVEFSEPLDSASVKGGDQFELKAGGGAPAVTVQKAELDSADPKKVKLTLSAALKPTDSYNLHANGITDVSKRKNPVDKNKPVPVNAKDTRPPGKPFVTAGENMTSVVVEFDEPLDRASAQIDANYQIQGMKVTGAQLSDPKKVVLTTDKAFDTNSTYTLKLLGIADDSPARNAIKDEVQFQYVDNTPLNITAVSTPKGQLIVVVDFNKTLDAASAQDPKNYTIKNPDVAINGVRLTGDKAVELSTAALFPGNNYELAVRGVKSGSGRVVDATKSFAYGGAVDKEPPVAQSPILSADSTKLTVPFTKALDGSKLSEAQFKMLADNGTGAFVERAGTIVATRGAKDNEAVINLGNALDRGSYRLDYDKVFDPFGNSKPGSLSFITEKGESLVPNIVGADSEIEGKTELRFNINKTKDEVDPSSYDLANFAVTAPGSKVDITGVDTESRKLPNGRTLTIVTLKLAAKLPASVELRWNNMKIKGYAKLHNLPPDGQPACVIGRAGEVKAQFNQNK